MKFMTFLTTLAKRNFTSPEFRRKVFLLYYSLTNSLSDSHSIRFIEHVKSHLNCKILNKQLTKIMYYTLYIEITVKLIVLNFAHFLLNILQNLAPHKRGVLPLGVVIWKKVNRISNKLKINKNI